MSELIKTIEAAYRILDEDPNLAIYMVRDFPELEKWDLRDLAWAMYKNTVARSEVKWLLDTILNQIEMEKENLAEWHSEHYDCGDN